uniref:Secreted protein n=1 Tax=Romanomermis culicivorax TaxID=13658 RepID=A0A915IG38_ROMCU
MYKYRMLFLLPLGIRWSSFKLLSQDPDRPQRTGRQGTSPPARPRLYYQPGMAWGKREASDYYSDDVQLSCASTAMV